MSTWLVAALCSGLFVVACRQAIPRDGDPGADEAWEKKRHAMVRTQIEDRGVKDERVLAAMRKVPRHKFVPEGELHQAYDDHPLPIGSGQTISQPYIVAFMTEAIRPRAEMKVLEIGTGSGYQAAVLAELVAEVYTIEIVELLGKRSGEKLKELGYKNIHVRIGDGYDGWPDQAPFDAIMLTAAPARIPQPLLDQLKPDGVLVAPVGELHQELRLYRKTATGVVSEDLLPVRFVPMTGKARKE